MKYKILAAAVAVSLGLAGCSQPEQTKEQTVVADDQHSQGQAELGSFVKKISIYFDKPFTRQLALN